MSGQAVSRVFESDLPPDLKFTAAVLASFAGDDGRDIYPGMGRVAYLRGISERAVQYHVKELRDMDVLEVVRPATQWHATHYRLVFERLPARPPYQAVDRQRSLLDVSADPPGVQPTSPLAPQNSGVKPASPLPGVKYSVILEASGVKPTSPDPSVQRSVSTHTDPARAREAAALPMGPVAPSRAPDHRPHAWCGRKCVPKFVHREFIRALDGVVGKRPRRLRAFYAARVAAYEGRALTDEPAKFWRAEFAAHFPRATAARAPALTSPAWICPHLEPCAHQAMCQIATTLERPRKTG